MARELCRQQHSRGLHGSRGGFLGALTSVSVRVWCTALHLASRDTLGSGFIPFDRENLKAWIDDPQHLKPGCNMPALKLDPEELDLVVAYLMTLH